MASSLITNVFKNSRRLTNSSSLALLNKLSYSQSHSYTTDSTEEDAATPTPVAQTQSTTSSNNVKASSISTTNSSIQNVSELQEPACPDRLLQRLVVECQGNERAVLKSYSQFITMTCSHLDIEMLPLEFPTPVHQRLTLLKSVHIHKKHRVQYEMRTYFLRVTLQYLTGSTADTFLEYIQRMCPESVAMHVTEHKLNKFPSSVMQVLDKVSQQRGSKAAEAT